MLILIAKLFYKNIQEKFQVNLFKNQTFRVNDFLSAITQKTSVPKAMMSIPQGKDSLKLK